MPITERLRAGLLVLFIGYNPSLTSFERGFNYAGKSNRFYRILYESGLTDRLYRPDESPLLLEDYGYGFTNIVARPTKTAAELTKEEYAEGRIILKQKVHLYKPKYACYVGKGVYEAYAGQRGGIPWGFQATSIVQGTTDFVAPSSSGLVRMRLAEQTAIYQALAKAVRT